MFYSYNNNLSFELPYIFTFTHSLKFLIKDTVCSYVRFLNVIYLYEVCKFILDM